VHTDGTIVVVGANGPDSFVARYTSSGVLDPTFDGDGIVNINLGGTGERLGSVTILSDGRILAAGENHVIRLTTAGALDATFDGDGILSVGHNTNSLVVQSDGKIAVTGLLGLDLVITRFDGNGVQDTSFGVGGTATLTHPDVLSAYGVKVIQQSNDKLLVVGTAETNSAYGYELVVVRLNTDGSFDTGFSDNGVWLSGLTNDYADGYDISLYDDGVEEKIVVGGYDSRAGFGRALIARLNADGTLDTSYQSGQLDSNPTYVEGGSAVVLDANVQIFDQDLSSVDDFSGSTLTLARNGGANSDDALAFDGTNVTTSGANVLVDGVTVGTYTFTGGELTISFGANATNVLVNTVMQNIVYWNSSDAPPASVQIDWTFNDGGDSVQTQGGSALQTTGSTTVNITAVNDAPTLNQSTQIFFESFENPDVTGETVTNPTGWVENAHPSYVGILDEDTGSFSTPYGQQALKTYYNAVATTTASILSDTLQAGIEYSLSVNVARFQALASGDYQIELLAIAPDNSTTVLQTASGKAYLTDFSETAELTFSAGDGHAAIGHRLAVRLRHELPAAYTNTPLFDNVILETKGFSLAGTDEDTPSIPTTVDDLLTGAAWADADSNPQKGIAITAAIGNGTWQYSSDGTTWTDVGAVASNNGLLLDASYQVRYVPDGENGETAKLDFLAWDQTSGSASTDGSPSYADPGVGGGSSAFSEDNGIAIMSVTAVNDTPDVVGPGSAYSVNEQTNLIIHGTGFSVTDVDVASGTLAATLSVGEGILTITEGNSGVTLSSGNGTSTVVVTGTLAQINNLLAGVGTGTVVYFNNSDTPSASTTITLTVNDGGNTGTDPGLTGNGTSEEDSASQTINIMPVNDAPTVDHGGPYVISEGDSLSLNASGSTDIDGDTLTYRWDLNNDATYDITTTSATIAPAWGALNSYGIDDDGVYTIGLQVDDGNGGIVTTSTTVTVNNVAPTLTATGAATVGGGDTYTLTLTDVDPGNDTISSWIVNWGDGTIDTYVGDPSSVTHVYSNDLAGLTFNISVSAIDEDGQYFEANLLAPAYGGDFVNEYDGFGGTFVGSFAPSSDGILGHANIVFMPNGNYLVSGVDSGNIVEYQPDGTLVGDFVAASNPNLSAPGGMAYGPDGNLYVADYGAERIVRFNGTTGAYLDNFVASGLTSPLGLEFGPDGNLYVANRGSAGVLRYDGVTGVLDASFNVASISGAEDLTFGPDGNIYGSSHKKCPGCLLAVFAGTINPHYERRIAFHT
jgi:large repetitive protein